MSHRILARRDGDLALTRKGTEEIQAFGIDLDTAQQSRRALCKECLDWSVRRSHLAGGLGTALLDRFYDLGWARREKASRVVTFTPPGLRAFEKAFVN